MINGGAGRIMNITICFYSKTKTNLVLLIKLWPIQYQFILQMGVLLTILFLFSFLVIISATIVHRYERVTRVSSEKIIFLRTKFTTTDPIGQISHQSFSFFTFLLATRRPSKQFIVVLGVASAAIRSKSKQTWEWTTITLDGQTLYC